MEYLIQEKFSFKKLCQNCKKQPCCTNFGSAFVFLNDLKKLKRVGKANENYLKAEIIRGRLVTKLKKKNNSMHCVFWDDEKTCCSIYENRPFDCKLFPFDIYLIDGEYHWIVYSCNPDSDWSWCEGHLEMLENDNGFNDLMENIEAYSDPTWQKALPDSAMQPYTKLRKVKWLPKGISEMEMNEVPLK